MFYSYMSMTLQALGRHRDKFRTFGVDKAVTSANPGHILQPRHSEHLPGF